MSSSQPRQNATILIAAAKLPDDLSLAEFASLTMAVQGLVDFAWWATDYPEGRARYRYKAVHFGLRDDPRQSRMLKAQYGSDFLVGIAIALPIAGVLTSLALGVERLGRAAKSFAEARHEHAIANAIDRDPRPSAEARRIDAEAELKRAEAARTLAESRQTDLQTELMAAAARGLPDDTEHRREELDGRRQYLRTSSGRRESEAIVAEALGEAGLPEAAQVYLDGGDRETGGAFPPVEMLAAYGVRIDVPATDGL